jgi:hypothetical protein
MSAQHLANKFRRAIRNDTGTHFSADELRTLGEWGLSRILLEREDEELSTKWAARKSASTQSGHSGLPPASNRHSFRSGGMTREERSLAAKALAAGR